MKRIIGLVLILICALVAVVVFRKHTPEISLPKPLAPPTDSQAAEAWHAWNAQGSVAVVRITEDPGAFLLLADLNDDAVIDDADRALQEAGQPELMRRDDRVCNGRTAYHDRTVLLDDDLQMVIVQVPANPDPAATIRPSAATPLPNGLAVYVSDFLGPDSAVTWPLKPADHPFYDPETWRLPLWLKMGRPSEGPFCDAFTFALSWGAEAAPSQEDSLDINVVGGLGDPDYFAAARDYLSEPVRAVRPFTALFLDETYCTSSEAAGKFETFSIVAMPHLRTKMTVLETYYDKPAWGERTRNVMEAARDHSAQHVIINGSYFRMPVQGPVQHGRDCLGAVVVDHELSEASGRHTWHTDGDPRRPENAEWFNPVFSLVQAENRPGCVELVPEPAGSDLFVPTVSSDGQEDMPHMALGGLNTVHDFVNSLGGRKSYIWFSPSALDSSTSEQDAPELIWLAMSNAMKSTNHFGGAAFREALRRSGLTIEEENPGKGIPPGRCDIAYFDGGSSVCMAVRSGEAFEFPILSPRHDPSPRTTPINNYVMFQVVDDMD